MVALREECVDLNNPADLAYMPEYGHTSHRVRESKYGMSLENILTSG